MSRLLIFQSNQIQNILEKISLANTHFKVVPVTSKHEGSIHEHLFKMVKVFTVLISEEIKVVKIGDARVLWVATNIHHLAAAGQKFRWEHGELEKGY